MEESRLAEKARRRLVEVLADDRPDPAAWMSRLRSWSASEDRPPFAHAVRLLFHLELKEPEAEALVGTVMAHRAAMTEALRRDPGLRVAGADYLSNIDGRLHNPKIVAPQEFDRAERSARTDALTHLANRQAFRESLDHEVRRARRYRSPVALIMADLDRFKDVNDLHGHLAGDAVLERAAAALRRTVRESDLAARYGGEEFAVILPETTRGGAYVVGERIRLAVSLAFATFEFGGKATTMTVSVGIATFPDDGASSTALIARADEALYAAKHAGRDRVVAFHAERRGAFRFPARSETPLAARDRRGGRSVAVSAVNVSATGILVAGPDLGPPATQVLLDLPARTPNPLDAPASLEARVVRVEAGVDGPRRAALAFEAPLGDDLLRRRLAANVSPARGARGVRR